MIAVHFTAFLALGLTLASAAVSAAEAPGKGTAIPRIMALEICKRCHNTAPDAKASDAHVPGIAPAFTVVAADPQIDRERLLRFVRFPHGEMDTVVLNRREAEELADYILGLRPAAANPTSKAGK